MNTAGTCTGIRKSLEGNTAFPDERTDVVSSQLETHGSLSGEQA
jgi:hypothetical protein